MAGTLPSGLAVVTGQPLALVMATSAGCAVLVPIPYIQFLYNEGENYVFMDQSTYEQVEVNSEQLGEIKHWLDGEEECKILFWDGAVLNIEPPTFVEKKVVSTEPGLKGDTVSNTLKPAKLSSGIEVQVPLFVNEDDTVKIDTRDGSYVGRVKE